VILSILRSTAVIYRTSTPKDYYTIISLTGWAIQYSAYPKRVSAPSSKQHGSLLTNPI